jgi:hypothetical protein
MKLRFKKVLLVLVCIVPILSGCSLLDGINNSLNYVDQTTTYINDVTLFAENIQTFAVQAATDTEVRNQLKAELELMKEKIINFNAIEAPLLAKEIHSQLVSYNEKLLTEINGYLDKINTHVDFEAIKDTQILQTIEKIINIQQQLEQLGL